MFGMFLIGTIILIKKENGEFSFFLYSGELFMFDGDGNEFSSFREAFTQLENHFKSFLIENREKIMRKLQSLEDECFKQLNLNSPKNWNTKINLGLREVTLTKKLLMRF